MSQLPIPCNVPSSSHAEYSLLRVRGSPTESTKQFVRSLVGNRGNCLLPLERERWRTWGGNTVKPGGFARGSRRIRDVPLQNEPGDYQFNAPSEIQRQLRVRLVGR